MPVDPFERWERQFREAAKADKYALFRKHLSWLGLPDKPELLLDGTIYMVGAWRAYAGLDGRPFSKHLAMQRYDPREAARARYALTFDLGGKAFGRLLVATLAKVGGIDLADLYNHPWREYETAGYTCFWVSRTDGRALSDREMADVETAVNEDLFCDYSEDELNVWFEESSPEGTFRVWLHERDASGG